jgi:hypothetical protein
MNQLEIQGGLSNEVDLPFSFVGMELRVGPGIFKVGGEDYELADEQVYIVEGSDTEPVFVSGYLVKKMSDGSAALLVDERVFGEESYRFEETSPYQLLHLFVRASVPAGIDDLHDAEVTVAKVLASDDIEGPQE